MVPHVARLRAAGLAAALLAPAVLAQQAEVSSVPADPAAPAASGPASGPPSAPASASTFAASDQERRKELAELKAELAEQRALVNKLVQELQAQRQQIRQVQDAQQPVLAATPLLPGNAGGPATAGSVLLSEQRGAGALADAMAGDEPGGQAPVAQPPVLPAQVPSQSPPPMTPPRQAQAQAQAPQQGNRNRPNRPPEVAPLFEQPGVLTPRGKYILEPSAQFGYSSSNRVALVGYTVIPALLIGLVDVRELKRNTFTTAITGRTGLSNRMEVEVKVPYVYRSDATVSRELFTGTAVERVFDTSGKGLGDIEIAGRYQINNGGLDKGYYIGGMRYKSRTGRDPFEVVTDCVRRCIGENVTGTGLPLSLPTGSGFHSLQWSLTWLYPSDPAVFFGNLSYVYNFKREGVSRLVREGVREPLGELAPGDVIGFNFGMGLALNDKASLSLGYDHSTIARMKQNGAPVPGSVRTQLGTLLLGYSYRFNEKRSLNIAVGAGVTRDTPDVTLTVRMPFTF